MSVFTGPRTVREIQMDERDLRGDRYPIEQVYVLTQEGLVPDVPFRDRCSDIIQSALPPDKGKLSKAYDINKEGFYAWVPVIDGEKVFLHHCALLDLDQDPRKPIWVVIGGGVPDYVSWQWLTTAIAAMGGRVLALSGIRSKSVGLVDRMYQGPPLSSDFSEEYYGWDALGGAFFADGYLHDKLLNGLADQGQIQGPVNLVGLSTGAGVILKMAEMLQMHPQFASLYGQLASLHLVGPCACLPQEADMDAQSRDLIKGFIWDSIRTAVTDWRQVVVNWLDAGEGFWGWPDLFLQTRRCVASSLPNIATKLGSHVEINIHAGRDDRAIPYRLVRETIEGLDPGEVKCPVRVIEIQGGHGIAVTSSTSLAHLLRNWPGPR